MSGIAAAVLVDKVVREGLLDDPEAVSRGALAVEVPEDAAE